MKKHLKVLLFILAAHFLTVCPSHAESELEGGFLTDIANRAMERKMSNEWISAPKIGVYYNGGYKYSSAKDAHGGPGFTTRLIRAYVSGTLLKHFDYRIQVELQGTFHMKDVYLEYTQLRPARIKMGQFKRPFGFENPMNPWDVGLADYSQFSKKMSGSSDHTAPEYKGSNGGRDLGLQVQGDFLPVTWGGEKHDLLHYKIGIFNGQGINTTDANNNKDVIGTIQIQPVKGLQLAVFAWNGSYTSDDGLKANKTRWAAGIKWEHKGWALRSEYAHHSGQTIEQLRTNYSGKSTAQAWYATAGAPVTPWFNIYAKWDCYTPNGQWTGRNDIFSLSPNFRLHKDLMFNIQWNYVNNHATGKHHHELWAMTWVRI